MIYIEIGCVYAIVGAASVVTHDVEDYEVVVGIPARVIKTLDADRVQQKKRRLLK